MQPKNLSRSIRAIFRLCQIGRRSIIIPDTGNTTAIRMLMHVVGMSIMDNCPFKQFPKSTSVDPWAARPSRRRLRMFRILTYH